MRSILNDLEAMTTSKGQHPGHVTGEAAEVNRDDRLATRRQTTLGMIKIDATGALFDIDQYDLRAEMQSRCRRVYGDSLDIPAHESSEFLFKLACFGPGREPPRSQNGYRCSDFLLADGWPKAWDACGSGTRLGRQDLRRISRAIPPTKCCRHTL